MRNKYIAFPSYYILKIILMALKYHTIGEVCQWISKMLTVNSE